MDLPEDLALFHQPVRLRIMGLLYRQRDASFTRMRDLLGLTDGNLASHTKRLAEAGYVSARRVLTPSGFESRIRITRGGADAFGRYLDALRAFLDAHEAAEAPLPRPEDDERGAGNAATDAGG